MPYQALRGKYGTYPLGYVGDSTDSSTAPGTGAGLQPAAPIPTALTMAQLQAEIDALKPVGPPPDAQQVGSGLAVDWSKGNIWWQTTKIAIIPGLISAVAIKLIMFGGTKAANKLRSKFSGDPVN